MSNGKHISSEVIRVLADMEERARKQAQERKTSHWLNGDSWQVRDLTAGEVMENQAWHQEVRGWLRQAVEIKLNEEN
jgi:hypothetical protein